MSIFFDTPAHPADRAIEPKAVPELDLDFPTVEEIRAREWQAAQLHRLGLPAVDAETVAGAVDWHAVADPVRRGCSPALAVGIVR